MKITTTKLRRLIKEAMAYREIKTALQTDLSSTYAGDIASQSISDELQYGQCLTFARRLGGEIGTQLNIPHTICVVELAGDEQLGALHACVVPFIRGFPEILGDAGGWYTEDMMKQKAVKMVKLVNGLNRVASDFNVVKMEEWMKADFSKCNRSVLSAVKTIAKIRTEELKSILEKYEVI
jgi:hypothetical protein